MTIGRIDRCGRPLRRRNRLRSALISFIAATTLLAGIKAQTRDSNAFRDLAQRAASARDKGDLESAIDLYRRALAQKPEWQEGWWDYGSLLYDNSQFVAASTALHNLTALNPKLGGAWALLGLSEYGAGRYEPALDDLEQARSLGTGSDPNVADVVDYHLALLLNAKGEPEAADLLLSPLLLRGRNSEDLQVALGLTLLRVPLLPSQVDPSKDALIHDAGTLAAVVVRKQYEDADQGFQAFSAKYPGTSFVHYAWGAMLASEGKDDAAEVQFRKETELNPESAPAYTEWAYLESKAGRYPESVALAQKAVQLAADSFMAQYVLGSSLLATGQAEQSLAHLERARDLAPESPEICYSLSRAYAKLGKGALAKKEQAEFVRLKNLQRPQQETSAPASAAGQPSPLGSSSQP